MPTARLEEIELNYEERGSGPALLLIPGIPAIASDWATLAEPLAFDRLPAVEAPTLIITGDDDRVIPAASSDPLHEQIPNSRLQVVRGVGHLFFIEAPEETLTALSRFFHN